MRIFGLAILLLCVLLSACGDDSPLQPESQPIPEMFPLAQGAKWEYQFYYNYYYSYEPPDQEQTIINDITTGKYTLTVTTQRTFQDSMIYVISAVTEPDSNGSISTAEWQVRLYSDTLWYRAEQNWTYLMPAAFQAAGAIDILIFVPPLGQTFYTLDGTLFVYRSERPDGHYYNKGYVSSESYALIDDTGCHKLHILWSVGPQQLQKDSWLVSYTPGTP